MTHITRSAPGVTVSVRFFAAARDAAGADSAFLTLDPGSTVADAIGELSGHSEKMQLLLRKCTFLCDGIAVRDPTTVLSRHQTLDVLPPFAGG
ncbi:MAG: MoaD/ThiS family protein [Mycobacteriaceae bacterium]